MALPRYPDPNRQPGRFLTSASPEVAGVTARVGNCAWASSIDRKNPSDRNRTCLGFLEEVTNLPPLTRPHNLVQRE